MKWKTLEYSKTQVIKAGKMIRDADASSDEYRHALEVVDNWRAAHAFPLQVFYCNLSRKFDQYIVAQRIKRLNSIVEKLRREPRMNLWEMQDLGGCRIIVPTLLDVKKVIEEIECSRIRHKPRPSKNYIENPKPSGYRSHHLIYRYNSDKKEEYNQNMLIEIQVRTRLQHLWATAVETMGNIVGQSLKSGAGDADALRFFSLASSLFASIEGMQGVPNCPESKDEIIKEMIQIDTRHRYLDRLESIRQATSVSEDFKDSLPKNGYMVLQQFISGSLRLNTFKSNKIDEAIDFLQRLEKDSPETDTVLVRVSSLAQLRKAYPNYYSDIDEFDLLIRSEMYGGRET